MGAIQFTDRRTAARVRRETRTLAQAAVAALPAPSIFNSQPWRWRISDECAELHADRARQLRTIDPDGRLLTVSCGIALHHALVSLAAQGSSVELVRFPRAAGCAEDPDLLARIRVTGRHRPDPMAVRLNAAMAVRRTDRRPFADEPVSDRTLERLVASVEAHHAHLHVLRPDEVVGLTAAAGRANLIENTDPEYADDVRMWTQRGSAQHDGVTLPEGDAAEPARPVPMRDFRPGAERDSPLARCPGCAPVSDRQARYAVLFTDNDEPSDWLTAGEALSAVLLNAADEGLAVSPMSEAIEVPVARWRLRSLLSGVGHPVVALRLGVAAGPNAAPAPPRRQPGEAIDLPAGDPTVAGTEAPGSGVSGAEAPGPGESGPDS